MDAARPAPHPGSLPPAVQRPPRLGYALLELLVGSVFLVHAGPNVVKHLHQWRQEVDLGQRGLVTTADFTQRRSSPDAENPAWFVSYRLAPSAPQPDARFEREVAVNFDQYRALARLQRVSVRYLPENPAISRLEFAGSSPESEARWSLLWSGCYAAFFGLFFLGGCSELRNVHLLQRDGKEVKGRITHRWRSQDGEGQTTECVAFVFRPPGHPPDQPSLHVGQPLPRTPGPYAVGQDVRIRFLPQRSRLCRLL